MNPQSNIQWEGHSRLSIFLNDSTDSDNEGSAEFWVWGLQRYPAVKGIFIAEPRHVNLDYYMTHIDFKRCVALIEGLQPPLEGGDSFRTTLLAGRLTQEMIKSRYVAGRPLTEDERNLLSNCIKPNNGSKEDSIKHAELVRLDYLTTMRKRSHRFESYLDVGCLDKLASPINLKAHHHEELVARTAGELDAFRTIMDMPTSDEEQLEKRREKLRDWYSTAIERKRKELGGEPPFEKLSHEYLARQIRTHDEVDFFGGASLTVLQELLENHSDVVKKINYYQQGGTFNSKLNFLGNPYNFALNTSAAESVFNNCDKLAGFTLIPTDTTIKLKWTVKDLATLSPSIGLRSLAFHEEIEAWEMISPKERDGEYHSTEEFLAWRSERASDPQHTSPCRKGDNVIMADLTAILAAFTRVFDRRESEDLLKQNSIRVSIQKPIHDNNQMILRRDEMSKMECLMFEIAPGKDAVLTKSARTVLETALKTFLCKVS